MSLIQAVLDACRRLDSLGWRDFLLQVSDLDIRQSTTAGLASELSRPLARIDRTAPGFTDFSLEGTRGIQAGKPARSLLFHAVAAPGAGAGQVLGFPTPDDIECIENYVYGIDPPSIRDLGNMAGGAPLAIVVYACEYRPAVQTVQRRHADMCYSRTGVARIGSAEAIYVPAVRGYRSLGTEPGDLHVIPCRYSAYIAAQLPGDAPSFGPMTFRQGGVDAEGNPVTPDSTRLFWVPLQKLFSGAECIRGRTLNLQYSTDHRNEKLRRIHLYLEQKGYPTRYTGAILNSPPFVLQEDALARITSTAGGSLLVTPLARPLAEEVTLNDAGMGLHIVPGGATPEASFRIPCRPGGGRQSPEYVYARQELTEGGRGKNLNGAPDVARVVNLGEYTAQHYLDHTGDGWIQPRCDGLSLELGQELAAYSILAAPDLFPSVKLVNIFDWWTNSLTPPLQAALFPDFEGSLPMEHLSDARITANIAFRNTTSIAISAPVFVSNDDSYTAVVSLLGSSAKDAATQLNSGDDGRVTTLPDTASGLFAPGWDVSMDLNDDENSINGVLHLAAYGGGSPFLEDVRLCAAESGFWPALAPDTTRQFVPAPGPTVTPIFQSRLGWDGLKAPELIGPGTARFHSLAHADYVSQALGAGFDFAKIGATTADDYKTATLLMGLVYEAVGADDTVAKIKWSVLYFDRTAADDPDLKQAEQATGVSLRDSCRFLLIYPTAAEPEKGYPMNVIVGFQRSVLAFATTKHVLYLDTWNAGWRARAF